MKLLCYQARSFSWEAKEKNLSEADPPNSGSIQECAVIWLHIEKEDEFDQKRIFKHTLKNIKWIANKRSLSNIVLHSFAHLGGITADSRFAKQFLTDLSERLQKTGYHVQSTAFGWFCSWNLDVYGDSMAKVFLPIDAKTEQ